MGALTYAVPADSRIPKKLFPLLLCYNLGRIFSYTLAGALIGATSWFLAGQFPLLGTVLRFIAGLMLIAMGFYLANWWSVLRHLERAGSRVWKHIQPLLSGLMPVNSIWRALLVGTLWGWIPCGLIYSALTWAATASNWQQSAMMMFFFGLGTVPAVLATGIFLEGFKKLMQSRGIRSTAGLLIIAFGLWTLPLHGYHNHSQTTHQGHTQSLQMEQHKDHQSQSDEAVEIDIIETETQAMLHENHLMMHEGDTVHSPQPADPPPESHSH